MKTEATIDFQSDRLPFGSVQFPEYIPLHTAKALELYLLDGLPPGGFLEAVLCNNLFRAVAVADSVNQEHLWSITKAVLNIAPIAATGSYENIEKWCEPDNEERLAFKDRMEKTAMWTKLGTIK